MIISEYIPGDQCDQKKDYVPSETYDKVLYALHRKERSEKPPKYLSCRTYRTYDEFIKYAQYAAGWNDAMRYVFGEDEE